MNDARYRTRHVRSLLDSGSAADLTQAAGTVLFSFVVEHRKIQIVGLGVKVKTAISAPTTAAVLRIQKIATGTTTPVVEHEVSPEPSAGATPKSLTMPGAVAANTVVYQDLDANTDVNLVPDYFECSRGDLVQVAIETQGSNTQAGYPFVQFIERPDSKEGPT